MEKQGKYTFVLLFPPSEANSSRRRAEPQRPIGLRDRIEHVVVFFWAFWFAATTYILAASLMPCRIYGCTLLSAFGCTLVLFYFFQTQLLFFSPSFLLLDTHVPLVRAYAKWPMLSAWLHVFEVHVGSLTKMESDLGGAVWYVVSCRVVIGHIVPSYSV